jgi:GntR family transcriptional regulator, transcriptional repressor for pyruvate dehydrogenase complex
MEKLFSEIRPLKISEGIASQIKDLIKTGALQPGDKLPPERNLAAYLGVGRSSLREAINILETMGFVEKNKRKGIFIRSLSAPMLSNPLRKIIEEDTDKLFQLYEIRKDIELASVCFAALRRTPADLERIETVLLKMERDALQNHVSMADDIEFHLSIARATQNVIRVHILNTIFELYAEFINFVIDTVSREKADTLMNLALHQKIFAAIKAGDNKEARKTMMNLFNWIEGRWKKTKPHPPERVAVTRSL